MKKDTFKRLPPTLKKQVEAYGVTEENYILSARFDMDFEEKFVDGWLLLTKEQVVIAQATKEPMHVKQYKGCVDHKDKMSGSQSYNITIRKVREIASLQVLKQVATTILFYRPEAEGAQDYRLAISSNLYMGQLRHLTAVFKALKEGKELTEELLQGEKEDEYCPKCGTMYPDRNRKICPKCMNKSSVFFRAISYFKPYIASIVGMFGCILGTAILNLAWPYLNGTILYDKVLARDEHFLKILNLPAGKFATALFLVVLSMFLTKLCIQICGIIQGVLNARIIPGVVKKLKTDVFDSMGKLSMGFYNSKQTGNLMTRVMGDSEEVTGFFIDGLPYMASNIFSLIATAVIMLKINWKLAVPVLIWIPVVLFTSYKMAPILFNYFSSRHRARRSLNSRVNDNLTGARVVKAFGKEEKELSRFDKYNKKLMSADIELVRFDNRFTVLYSAVENLSNLLVWGLGGFLLFHYGDLEIGVLITFISYVTQLNNPLDFLAFSFHWWAESMSSAQRMFEIIDSIPEITEKEDPVHMSDMKGDIELKNVTFSYDKNKTILKHVSLKVEGGKMLGIVGRSGAGKTTLVNMISRLYDPDEGEIFIDGVLVKDIAFSDLRRNVAMVSQETYIFMGSVYSNIAYANPNATKEEVVHAAVLASAHDFICKMPDGYDTIIGATGRELSGGERQRISIARAILANPKILILDEATASVDTETEKAIQASINYLIKGRTTISIAHRLSTLRDADRLVVMDEGEITEEGTHEELLKKKGTYYKLRELQTKALAMRGLE
ncbi:MAG: ABC transporter transmembrane domain-containing protein [Lachnospiraceae bacterium]